MIYDVHFSHSFYESREVKARTKKEAEAKAQVLVENFKNAIIKDIENIKPTIQESRRNYLLDRGAIYLIKKYKQKIPAECVRSDYWLDWKGNKHIIHTLRYLGTENYIRTKDKSRVIRKLCNDSRIKPKCKNCVARFICFTGN